MRNRYLARPQPATHDTVPWWRRIPWAWLLAFIACSAVMLSVGTYYAQLQWSAYAGWVGFGTLAIAAGGGWLVFTEGDLQGFGKGLDLWILTSFAGMALISIGAPDGMRSWLAMTQCLLYAWIGYGALQAFTRFPWHGARFLAAGLAAMLVATYTIHTTFASFWGIVVEPMAEYLVWPVGHWNFFGSYLCLTWPIAAVLARQGVNRQARWGWGALTAWAMWSVIRCGSRSALVAMGLQVLAWAWIERPLVLATCRRAPRWLLALGGLTLVGGVGLLATRFATLTARLSTLAIAVGQLARGEQVTEISTAQRLEMWLGGWHGFLDRPWLGHGLGSVPTQFLPYQIQDPRFGDIAIPQLHNTFVHAAFEGGITLLALLLAGIILLAVMLWQAAKVADQPLRGLATGIGLGFLGYLACLQADFHWQVPSLSLTAVLLIALLGAVAGPLRLTHPAWRIGAGFLALPLFFAAVRMWLPAVQAHYLYDAGRIALAQNRPAETVALWDRAFQYAPTTLFYRLARGSVLHSEATRGGVHVDYLNRAFEDFHALNAQAILETSLLKEGVIAVQLNRPQAAIQPLERAAALVPFSGAPHYLLGMARFANQEPTLAVPALARAVACAPVLLYSSFLIEPPGQSVKAEVYAAAEGIVRYWLTLAPHESELHYRLGRIQLAAGHETAARGSFDLAVQELPTSVSERTMTHLDSRLHHARSYLDLLAHRPQTVLEDYRSQVAKDAVDMPAALLMVWANRELGRDKDVTAMAESVLPSVRTLFADATVQQLSDRAVIERLPFSLSLDRRDIWIIQSFRKLSPSFFFTALNFTGQSLFLTDEVTPWAGLPSGRPFAKD
ncbi:MAG: O-antigen ligase family protein [Candidatus Sericytochromatia bacterium]|nr:O-antigen ligase family protein [Candidatus Sericytochromatia bacterium]